MPFSPDYDVSEERRAYTFHAGPVGCLMLHGFMGSPISSRPLAQHLSEQGITVHCPLLPGHGERPDKMAGISRHAWLAEVEEAYSYLHSHCDEIFLMGHSMGTVLAAHLARQHPAARGVIMLAPLHKVPHRVIHLLRVLRYVMPWFYPWRVNRLRRLTRERVLDLYPDLDLEDPEVQEWLPAATRVPTDAIDEMRKMAAYGRKLWPLLELPALIVQGERDIAVRPDSAAKIHDQLASKDKQLHLFPRAGHELMRPFEPVHEEVWSLVQTFIVHRRTES
jgi:carboxylesterase